MEEMGAAVDAAAADDAVKVVIVRSASKKFFCAGADIKAFLANDTAGNMKMINRGPRGAGRRSRAIPKVFIAQIEGHALGGGLEISLACDLRFGARGPLQARRAGGDARPAARQRRHAAPAAHHRRAQGAGPDGHRPRDQPRRGARARHPQPPLRRRPRPPRRRASTPTSSPRGATAAIGEIKLTTYAGIEMPIADALARERAGIERLFGTADAQEGLSAFAEKRKAEFKGA